MDGTHILADPWKGLADAALKITSLSFRKAGGFRRVTKAFSNKPGANRNEFMRQKKASVAISCTLNTECTDIEQYFTPQYISDAKNGFNFAPTVGRSVKVLKPLLDILEAKKDIRCVLDKISELKVNLDPEV
ncbi:hypothetical protein BGZ65_006460, partial [Modicella reniformis]